MNTYLLAEEKLIDQDKKRQINSHEDGTSLKWLIPSCYWW